MGLSCLKLIGITGTNGKTTTAFYLKHILDSLGEKCGIIGTLGVDTGNGRIVPTGYTTPTAEILDKTLAEMTENGCGYCVMEVSSQGLQQGRTAGLDFRLGIFTNLSEEHLDYHKTRENYIAAKALLAAQSERVLVNADDAYAEGFLSGYRGNHRYFYSAHGNFSDYMAKNIRFLPDKTEFLLLNQTRLGRVMIPAVGEYAVYNALTAGSAALTENFDFYAVLKAMQSLPQIPGRAQILTVGDRRICIDYAHTPLALSQILTALRQNNEGRIITVFGCGGERDKEKRPLMGKIAANGSECVVLTGDNSRTEKTEDIIGDIAAGIKRKTDVFTIADREKAIRFAVNKANAGDTVLIAGKGHEDTIDENGEKRHFSDMECVKAIFGLDGKEL